MTKKIKNFNDFLEKDINKLFETKSTPQNILDIFTDDRLKNYDIDDNFEIRIERVKGSFKIVIVDKRINRVIGRVYIQEIKPNNNGGYKAELRRLYVDDNYRGRKFGELLLTTALNSFDDIDLYGYPSPNRNKDMNDDNVEIFRNRLIKFYDRIGLKKVNNTSNKVQKLSNKLY